MLRIGATQIATNIFLAPLSGCSDLAFRLIARECGAKFAFFEMIDAHALLGRNPKKFNIIKTTPQDAPIAGQLLGVDPALMRDAAQILLEHAAIAFLDVNSACPSKKVIRRACGAALLNTPAILAEIIRTLAVALPVPVTVKLRIGFDTTDLADLTDLAKACEANGAAALFVHGRTRVQAYSGDIDYGAIRAVKQAVRIPVLGSGNVFTPQLAKQMLTETDCDGVLVARGAFGSPWIFREIEHYLQHGALLPEEDLPVKKNILKKHLAYLAQYKDCTPKGRIGIMRKVTIWYLKGFPGAAKIRGQVCAIPEYEALVEFIDQQLEG